MGYIWELPHNEHELGLIWLHALLPNQAQECLSNFMVYEKIVLFYQYVKYCHNNGTSVYNTCSWEECCNIPKCNLEKGASASSPSSSSFHSHYFQIAVRSQMMVQLVGFTRSPQKMLSPLMHSVCSTVMVNGLFSSKDLQVILTSIACGLNTRMDLVIW